MSQYLNINNFITFLKEKDDFTFPIDKINGFFEEFKKMNEDESGKLDRSDKKNGSVSVESKEECQSNIKKVLLPYCGIINESTCQGIKNVHSLFIQCNKKKENGDYCEGCQKKNLGNIKDRGNENWTDVKGRKPARFANVAEKLGIDLEDAKKYAASIGVEIPPLELIKEVKKRGRPKKSKNSGGTTTNKIQENKEGEEQETKNDGNKKTGKKETLLKQINTLMKEADEEMSDDDSSKDDSKDDLNDGELMEEKIYEFDKSNLKGVKINDERYYIYKDPNISAELKDKNIRVILDIDLNPC